MTDLPELDYTKLNRELDRTKAHLFLGRRAGFLCPLMASMDWEWKIGLGTAATNGVKVMWDPHWFLTLPKETRKFVLYHELQHPARMHFLRQGKRKTKTWNYACDIVINNDAEDEGYTWDDLGFNPWYRPEYKGMVEEEIYEILDQQFPDPEAIDCPWNIDPQPEDLIEEDKLTRQKAINNVISARHSARINGHPGDVPGDVERLISQFLKPSVPWEKHLHRWMTDLLNKVYTWRKPNRRHHPRGIYLPGMITDKGKLAHLIVYQDVSGSVDEPESKRFNSELKYIWDRFKPDKLTVVQFDTIIQKEQTLVRGDTLNKIELLGGGGTCLKCVRKHMLDNQPTAAIVFSDLFVAPMVDDPGCPILWVAIDNRSAKVNFGELIHIKA